jgi:serine protease AprX
MSAPSGAHRSRLLAALLASTLLLAPGIQGIGGARVDAGRAVSVIVRAVAGAEGRVEDAVTRLGGTVTTELHIINGFAATVPRSVLGLLRGDAAVVSVSPNTHVAAESVSYDPGTDVNSMASTTQYLGATDWWNAGFTGAGIDVVVIDSGVSPVEGLDGTDKVIYGPDLSLESQAQNLTNLDSFGHGTFMAGLIAGSDPPAEEPPAEEPPAEEPPAEEPPAEEPPAEDPVSPYRGIAPDARIVSIKVGTADGGTDVSQVIAAIDWVVQHAHDPGFNMRIINLSYGTNATQSYKYDPLAYAAEQAWHHGIVVVAAAGNHGMQTSWNTPALTDPAYDPFLIAVGSSDSMGTSGQTDDTVPAFSSSAKYWGTRGPDLVAPGTHLQGLRVPNSYIDVNHPAGVIDDRYFRGSGTSQSAAITSGAVALILQRYPQLTPDQVKAMLKGSALYLPSVGSSRKMGSGELQLTSALSREPQASTQNYTHSYGTGSLELSRGTDHLTRDGVTLTGEVDIMGTPFSSGSMATLEAQGKSWSGGVWNGKSWSGNSWSGNSWSGVSWSGNSWSGVSWSSGSWTGNSWSGKSWSNTDWTGNSWSGNSWSGDSGLASGGADRGDRPGRGCV